MRVPAFFPDATRGAVRGVTSEDLSAAGVEGLMVNAFHLSASPGVSVVAVLGGIHRFTGFDGCIVSDSGGFQIYSLITRSKSLGRVGRKGFTYRRGSRRHELTPRKAVQRQWRLGADILFCLDHCTHPEDSAEAQRVSVENTVAWAAECRDEMDRLQSEAGPGVDRRLYAVVQGGGDPGLRRRCVEELQAIGFDGYGYGGWPVRRDGTLEDSVYQVAELVGGTAPLHALGVGSPANLVRAARAGYSSFDCVMPTRDARHGRLFVGISSLPEYSSINIKDERFVRADTPVEEGCDCECCRRHSAGYLHHLFEIGDPSGTRLAVIHNLRFYLRLMAWIRETETAGGRAAGGSE